MPLSYLLYGLALVLLVYIIVSITRTRKFKTGDAIATLGIIVSIIIAIAQRSGNPPLAITPYPVSTVERITIPSNTTSGVAYRATRTGLYIFQYIDSAYSLGNGNWSTLVYAFRGVQGQWNNDGTVNADAAVFSIGAMQFASAQAAINSSKSQTASVRLNEGESLILIVADLRDSYENNNGEIVLDVIFMP